MVNQNIMQFLEDKANCDKLVSFINRIADVKGETAIVSYDRFRELCECVFDLQPEDISKCGLAYHGSDKGRYIIAINEKQERHSKIFTLLHEVGHILLGHLEPGGYKDGVSEWEADLLASMMLFTVNGALPYVDCYEDKGADSNG